MCRPKHAEQLRNTGIINSTTRSHLVGSFYEILVLKDILPTVDVKYRGMYGNNYEK